MARPTLYLVTQRVHKLDLIPEATCVRFNYHLVTGVKMGRQRTATTTPCPPHPAAEHEQRGIYMPLSMAKQLMRFAQKHLEKGAPNYDCASFCRFLTTSGPSDYAPNSPTAHHTHSMAIPKTVVPYQHYVLMRSDTEGIHHVISLPGGFCMSVMGTNGQLLVSEIKHTMDAYGAPRLRRVERIEFRR